MGRKKASAKKQPVDKATKPATVEKSYNGYEGAWTSMNGDFGPSPDVYGEQQAPTIYDLLAANQDIVFACANLIANKVSAHADRTKLCVTTSSTDPQPKVATRGLSHKEHQRLLTYHKKYTRKAIEVREVIDHGLCDLLEKPNPDQSFSTLIRLTVLLNCIAGNAYWYKARPSFFRGGISELWLLPTQNVTIQYDDNGRVSYYKLAAGNGTDETIDIDPDDIIHFKYWNPLDPNGYGYSPLQAVWQAYQLMRQEQSAWQAVLYNLAFPSAIISAKDKDTPLTDMQAERLQKGMRQVFSLGSQGGVWVVQDALDYTPISTPPKDSIALSVYENVKTRMCNAYHIPKLYLDQSDTTTNMSDTIKRSFEEDAAVPNMNNILDTMTQSMCPPRLFFCCDDLVTPDRQLELQERAQTLNEVQANVIPISTAQEKLGYAPDPKMHKYLYELLQGGTMGTLPTIGVNRSIEPQKKKSVSEDSNNNNQDELAAILRRFYERIRESVTEAATKAFFPVDDWADELAAELVPVLRLALEKGGTSILGQIGGEVAVLPVLELERAAQQAAKRLAQSTLQTTNLDLEAAHEAVREAVRQGLEEGEANKLLTERLAAIFTNLTEHRCYLIAETESSNAKHAGELIAIQESGVEAKKVWLADALCCPKCAALDGMAVDLDKPFYVDPQGGPYAVCMHPALHPSCRCTMTYEFPEDEG